MCGKDECQPGCPGSMEGSPPHVQERRFYAIFYKGLQGITPACAGKTSCWFNLKALHQDHPRMCGKDTTRRVTADAT